MIASALLAAAILTADPPLVRLQFSGSTWKSALETAAKPLGLAVQLDFEPPGTVTYSDQKSMTAQHALDLLHGMLLDRGVTILRQCQLLIVVRLAEGVHVEMAPFVAAEDLASTIGNLYALTTFRLKAISARDARADLSEWMSPRGKIADTSVLNRVVVCDRVDSLRRIAEVLRKLDTPQFAVPLRIYVLQYITAQEAAGLVRQVLGLATPDQPVNPLAQLVDFNRMGEQLGNRQMLESFVPGLSFKGIVRDAPTAPPQIHLGVDSVRNALHVHGQQNVLSIVDEVVKSIDVKAAGEVRNDSQLRAFAAPRSDAKAISDAFDDSTAADRLLPAGDGVLLAKGSSRQIAALDKLLRKQVKPDLDVAVFELHSGSADVVATQLKRLFAGEPERGRPTFVVDPDGGRILARGAPGQLQQVRRLLEGFAAPRREARVAPARLLTPRASEFTRSD